MNFKINNLKFLTLAGTMLICQSCKSGDGNGPIVNPPGGNIDETTDCRNPQQSGAYTTFYKPQVGYVGDPMPYYNISDGTFYIFYLQDWRDGRFNEHPIHCVTTKDYGRFTGSYEAIPAGKTPSSQDALLGTGSFIERNGIYYGFYTGHNGSLNPAEKIHLATSENLRSWTKRTDFEIEAPQGEGFNRNDFRDPEVYYDPYRECYVMLVTSVQNGAPVLVRYASDNLLDWERIESLTDFDTDADIIECPNIFEMGGKWYLVFSRINRDSHRKVFYRIADTPEGPWRTVTDENGHHETFDGLFLYAGKTVSDGTNRYISGWCSSGDRFGDNGEVPWAGALVTHKLVRQPSGKLYPVIADAVDAKFNKQVEYKDILSEGSVSGGKDKFLVGSGGKVVFNRNGESFKITMTIKAGEGDRFGIGFGACGNQANASRLEFQLFDTHWGLPALSQFTAESEIDFTPLRVPADGTFKVTVVCEKTICVTYINDEVAFTSRISMLNQNPWMIYSSDGEVEFSDIKVFTE